jgi:hypothetical protein
MDRCLLRLYPVSWSIISPESVDMMHKLFRSSLTVAWGAVPGYPSVVQAAFEKISDMI